MGTVLVVDDERSMREFLAICLRRAGHATTLAESGEEALGAIERSAFDVIITDLKMPGTVDGLALLAAVPSGPGWGQQATVKQDLYLQSSTAPDIKLHLRERLPAGADPREIRDAVLFVHGATFGGDTFDLELPGYDWMTQIAQRGFAAYYVDLRGYGHSTRPPAMSQLPSKNEPFARAEEVVADIGDTVDFIRERTGADKVNLIGWSWGATTTGMYTAAHNDKVDRLVLFALLTRSRSELVGSPETEVTSFNLGTTLSF